MYYVIGYYGIEVEVFVYVGYGVFDEVFELVFSCLLGFWLGYIIVVFMFLFVSVVF